MNEPRYSIRPLGKTEWGNASTLEEAKQLLTEAQDALSSDTVLIIDNERDEVVSPDLAC